VEPKDVHTLPQMEKMLNVLKGVYLFSIQVEIAEQDNLYKMKQNSVLVILAFTNATGCHLG
jgi:hypothetical protein